MHPYSVDSKIRSSINFYSIVLSAVIFLILEETGVIENLINIQDTYPVISELSRFSLVSIAFTPFAIYITLFLVLEKWVGKWAFIGKWIGIPN